LKKKSKSSPIVIITDFGFENWYGGSLHGVLLSIDAQLRIVDVTHSIKSGDVKGAAFVLLNYFETFPPGTVFMVVVDPTVGSSRKPVCMHAGGYFFVGPDNGVFSYVMDKLKNFAVREISLQPGKAISSTFHGRDIFAPAAARLARGGDFNAMGQLVLEPVSFEILRPIFNKGTIQSEVTFIDKYGNCLTNIRSEHLNSIPAQNSFAELKSGRKIPFKKFYAEVEPGEALCLLGSADWLEISLNGGNAEKELQIKLGDKITFSGS